MSDQNDSPQSHNPCGRPGPPPRYPQTVNPTRKETSVPIRREP